MECRCPSPSHQDSTPSFKVYNDARAFCFGCEWKGDVIDYVKMRDGTDFKDACTWLEENLKRFPRNAGPSSDFHRTKGEENRSKPLTEVEKSRCEMAADRLTTDPAQCATIAAVRGWDAETIRSLAENGDLGWHDGRLAFIFESGMKVRDWPGRDFRWNCGSPTLWRTPNVEEPDTIFVTEGETDAISLIDAGVECCGGMVCALPSATTIRPEWFKTWKDKKVMLCFDNDEAGSKATAKVLDALKGITTRIKVLSFTSYSSIGDISDAHKWLGSDNLLDWLSECLQPIDPEPPEQPTSPKRDQGSEESSADGAERTKDALPPIYYSLATKEYLLEADGGTWIPVNENSVKRHLKALGHRHGKEQSAAVTPMEQALNLIQTKHCVTYAAPLAGYDAGFYHINGQKILVTTSPHLIEPVVGEFPVLAELLERMFVTEAKDQRPYLYGWLKVYLEALRAKEWRPGQVLAMCGPVECGKSLLQRLFTVLFGGRAGKPHQFMNGGTAFNEDLFEAEHLMIEDDQEATQHAQRKVFGSYVKAFAVNRDHRCHGKKKKGLILMPRWRVTISVNDEPQRLLVLPPVDQDTEDKIMLLKVNQTIMPMPQDTNEQRDFFWKTLVDELPAFVHFLLNWEIQKELRSARFGVRHYHHPDILGAVDELSNEFRMLNLIDEAISFTRGEPWTGTSMELERDLTGENSRVQYEARKLFYFNNACGTYLAGLSRKAPDRVQKLARSGNTRQWQINPVPGKHYSGMVFSQPSSLGQN